MKLGVISDTHDRIPYIEKAVEIFNSHDLAAVLHCGDFVAPFALLPFRRLKAPFFAVFGNNDGEKEGLSSLFEKNGWSLNNRPWTFELEGARIAMLHEPGRLGEFIGRGQFDLIVFGHTHETHFRKENGAMIINPGEGCGWVKGTGSVCVADLGKSEGVFFNL